MSDMKNDPSALYDADFKKKRDEILENEALEDGESADEGYLPDDEEDDVFEEKRSLFSRFRRKSKKKENVSNDGYDIFDLEKIDGEEKPTAAEQENTDAEAEKLDDINALLQSVGIAPMDEAGEPEQEELAEPEDEPDEQPLSEPEQKAEPEPAEAEAADGQTKFFTLPGSQNEKQGEKSDPESEAGTGQNADDKLQKTGKNLIDSFRVLANESDDKPILEKKPSGKAGKSIADTLETESGEDIFDAVDRAGTKKRSLQKLRENAAAAARKKQREEEMLSASALGQKLKALMKKTSRSAKIVLVLGAVSLILTFLPAAYEPGGALEFLFGSGARIYSAIQIALFAGTVGAAWGLFKDAFSKLRAFKTDSTACLLLMAAFALVHGIFSLAAGMDAERGFTLYFPCVIFAVFVMLLADYKRFDTMSKSLNLLVRSKGLEGLLQVENSSDAAALGHGLSLDGEPLVFFGAKAQRPKGFSALFEASDKSVKANSYLSIAVLAAGFVFGIAGTLLLKKPEFFSGGLVGCVCFCLPVFRDAVLEFLRSGISAQSLSEGAAALSFEACDRLSKANAVAIDAGDIFEGKISKFRLVRGGSMTLTDAVVYAAATLKGTHSMLRGAFDEFLEETKIQLPDAEDLQYEERLGYSCWIAGRRVLVGNRQMLVQHSIDAPTEEEEKTYSKNKSVMYVAVEGMIAATFIVAYSARASARKNMRPFAKTGIVLMLKCADPCLNESYAAKRLGTEEAAIKIVGTKGAQILEKCGRTTAADKNGGLICDRKQKSLLSVVSAAYSMHLAERSVTLLSAAAFALSFLLLVLGTALNITSQVSALAVIVIQALWGAAAYFYVGRSIK